MQLGVDLGLKKILIVQRKNLKIKINFFKKISTQIHSDLRMMNNDLNYGENTTYFSFIIIIIIIIIIIMWFLFYKIFKKSSACEQTVSGII
jgi:hypothetical protein